MAPNGEYPPAHTNQYFMQMIIDVGTKEDAEEKVNPYLKEGWHVVQIVAKNISATARTDYQYVVGGAFFLLQKD